MNEILPNEDLMREHGLINRMLLIYEHIIKVYECTLELDKKNLYKVANLIREFDENYHQKMEEKYIFPYVKIYYPKEIEQLIIQHYYTRKITDEILENIDISQSIPRIINLMKTYYYMYIKHEAVEDTVIYQKFKEMLSYKEYIKIGHKLENEEEKMFGFNGFNKILNRVELIEKELDIYSLEKLTDEVIKRIN